jgi:hypothetical protein
MFPGVGVGVGGLLAPLVSDVSPDADAMDLDPGDDVSAAPAELPGVTTVRAVPAHCRAGPDDARRAFKLVVDPELEAITRRGTVSARAIERVERWNGEGVRSRRDGGGGGGC